MARISMKRILSRNENRAVVQQFCDSLGSRVCIMDAAGTPLWGTPPGGWSGADLPVAHGAEVVALVRGIKGAAVIPLLQYMVRNEIERKALGHETLEKYREINMLCDFGAKIGSCLDLKSLVQIVLGEVRKLLPADVVAVLLCQDGAVAEVLSDSGDGTGLVISAVEPGGLLENFLVTDRPEIVNNLPADPRCAGAPQVFRSMICAPLKNRDKTVGYLCAGSLKRRMYTARDLQLLSTFSDQTAMAVEKAQLYDRLKQTFYDTVRTLAETIEKRDPYTGDHTRRVVDYSLAIARQLGLTPESHAQLELAAALHDIGKLGVRDDVLLKEGPLTQEEFAQMKNHAAYGEEILQHIRHMREIIPGVKHHHERFDGNGYPSGLKGKEIDIMARIIAVADAFDAMTSDRPYRKALSLEAACHELRRHAGGQFDGDVVDAFLAARSAEGHTASLGEEAHA